MEASALDAVLSDDGILHQRLHRYTQAMLVELAHNVACHRFHPAEERAARWLLVTSDRVGSDTFELTEEVLAQMLGVGAPTVGITAGILQSAGLIRYSRVRITITDRDGLHQASGACYDLVESEFARVA